MFAELLQEKKVAENKTDLEMAREIGVNHVSLNGWRNGKRSPSLKSFNKVVRHYRLDKTYAQAIWEDILEKRKTGWFQKNENKKAEEKHLIKNCKDEFYGLETKLVKEFGSLGKVPESNRKLKKMRKLVGV